MMIKISTNLDNFSKIAVLTDKNIARLWLNDLKKNIRKQVVEIIIPQGEKSKNLKTCQLIWKKMLDKKMDRRSLLINLGGGVICDLGGFVASTYMRGIAFINIPTTLLAMVDASVGGKTGINFGNIKNIIGTFYKPIEIIINVSFLKTLPKRIFVEGFAEIIKHAIIFDRRYFDLVTSKKPEEFTSKELEKIINRSIEIKTEIIQKDFQEKSLRKILNFGHTIGHAVEALSLETKKPLLHGEAVALGMILESRLANKLNILSNKDLILVEKAIKKSGCLPKLKISNWEKIMLKIKKDKKNNGEKILFSLPKKIGFVKYDIEVSEKLIVETLKSL